MRMTHAVRRGWADGNKKMSHPTTYDCSGTGRPGRAKTAIELREGTRLREHIAQSQP